MISQLGNKIYGYASVFDIVDQHNDIIAKGSFAKSIELFYQGKRIVLLWQHQFDQPIGIIDELKEDSYGLYVEATLLNSIKQGLEAFELIKSGAIGGLSIGYQPVNYYYLDNAKFRQITEVELL